MSLTFPAGLPRCLALSFCAAGVAVTAAPCRSLSAGEAVALTLEAALARVADCHPDVLAARAALGSTAADRITAGQGPNPQLTLGAQALAPGSIGSGSLWNKTFDHQLRVDQQIERGGKPALRRAAAEALHEAARADLAESQRQARLAVTRTWIDLWAARARRAQLEASAALNAESLRLLDQRVRAGDAAPLDATRFRLDDARALAELRQSEADARALAQQLSLAIGVAEGSSENLGRESGNPAAGAEPALPAVDAAALDKRPDVAAARERVTAAEHSRDLAAALATRDVGVGVQFDRYPLLQANPNGAGANNTVTLSVSMPLFVRHAYEGEAARAQADLAAAQQGWRRSLDTARGDLARAQALAQAALERRRLVVEQLEPAAEKVAAGAELAYRRGASGALDVIDARRNLRAVRIERIAADADWAKARAELLAATATIDHFTAP